MSIRRTARILLLVCLSLAATFAGPVTVNPVSSEETELGNTEFFHPESQSIPESSEQPPLPAVPADTLLPEVQSCLVDGEVFHNGARLPKHAGADPCRACYCQGGEPVCTRVHCYRRSDCAPRHVSGRCCPKYDNCPPAPDEPLPAERRFKDVATQTETDEEPSDTVSTTLEDCSTEGTTLTTETEMTSTLGSTSTTSETMSSSDTDSEELTSTLPPGIDLEALHDHLPFLSPGNVNGPNT